MKVYAIVAAGGTGSRFKSSSSRPKQFLKLNNKPVILYSLLALQKCKAVNHITVSADKKYFPLIRRLAKKHRITKLTVFAEAGKTRFESVRNAFRKIKGSENDLVLIHDSARPMINKSDVEKIIEEAKKSRAVIYGIKVSDTIKKSSEGYVSKTIDRKNLWLIQTPQIFSYKILSDAYNKSKKKSYTDEAALAEWAGYDVRIIDGKRRNVKITAADDFEIVRKLI